MRTLLTELTEEKVVLVDKLRGKFSFPLEGIVRFVDKKGKLLGLLLDRRTLEEIDEDFEAAGSDFLASLEKSRKSGRVKGKGVKRKAGL